uniref:Uncharacterized protein n=1 Tax=Daphnia galeata TaxID=27404 RepID=A0A8J2RC69_9CRUS|nr:unnamed protein product [Daphnia galeata]
MFTLPLNYGTFATSQITFEFLDAVSNFHWKLIIQESISHDGPTEKMTADLKQENGWALCRTEEDWRKLQNLIEFHESNEPPDISQRETLYKCPPTKQTLVKLLLINQEAIGFYIVRLKGLQEDGGLPFEMPILDGVFISKAYRRQGWGTAMIEDLKFLTNNPHHRSKLWAVENCGEEEISTARFLAFISKSTPNGCIVASAFNRQRSPGRKEPGTTSIVAMSIDTYHPASVRFKDNFSSRIFIEHVFGRPQIVEQDRSCSRSNGQNISTKANRSDAYSLNYHMWDKEKQYFYFGFAEDCERPKW